MRGEGKPDQAWPSTGPARIPWTHTQRRCLTLLAARLLSSKHKICSNKLYQFTWSDFCLSKHSNLLKNYLSKFNYRPVGRTSHLLLTPFSTLWPRKPTMTCHVVLSLVFFIVAWLQLFRKTGLTPLHRKFSRIHGSMNAELISQKVLCRAHNTWSKWEKEQK